MANWAFHVSPIPNSCFLASGGFSSDAGSFAGLSMFAGNYLHLDETLSLAAQYGVRSRTLQFGMSKPLVPDNHVQAGFALFGQRFRYDQSQEASLLAFSRDAKEAESIRPDELLKYVSHRYGAETFVNMLLPDGFSSVRLAYSYDVTGIRPLSSATSDYFSDLHFLNTGGTNKLSGIRTSRLSMSYVRTTIREPLRPSHGTSLSASFGVAGLGGDVNLIEPAVEGKWFHPGIWRRHVVAAHLRASLLSGFGGKAAPPFDRDYLGGEQEVRGFSSWAISPLAYVPGVATIPVLNPDGSPRVVPVLTGGVTTMAAVTIKIPVYRPLAIGGDTKVVANVEYRIPIAGPFTLALFTDAGLDRAVFTSQLKPNAGVIESLSAAFSSEFADRLPIQAESQRIRVSSGAEFQVLIPKIQAPVRLYWAYNVTACTGWSGSFCSTFTPPLVASPGLFPNFATYQSARQMFGVPQIHRDPRSMLRIAIGFSF